MNRPQEQGTAVVCVVSDKCLSCRHLDSVCLARRQHCSDSSSCRVISQPHTHTGGRQATQLSTAFPQDTGKHTQASTHDHDTCKAWHHTKLHPAASSRHDTSKHNTTLVVVRQMPRLSSKEQRLPARRQRTASDSSSRCVSSANSARTTHN